LERGRFQSRGVLEVDCGVERKKEFEKGRDAGKSREKHSENVIEQGKRTQKDENQGGVGRKKGKRRIEP